MALALNNLKRVDMPLNKETNQQNQYIASRTFPSKKVEVNERVTKLKF